MLAQYTVGILRPTTAFLPELRAIHDFLSNLPKVRVRYVRSMRELNSARIGIVPLGWAHPLMPLPQFSIGLYSSGSLGKLRGIRDAAKRRLNSRFDYFLYQNEYVQRTFESRKQSFGFLPMGYFPNLVQARQLPEFDIIYSGTVRRHGLSRVLNRLSHEGLRVCVAGTDWTPEFSRSIDFAGQVSIEEVYRLYSKAEFGLNYVPPVEPYSQQASTKCIEYFAAGLKVVSTRYEWVDQFLKTRGGSVFYLEKGVNRKLIQDHDYSLPTIHDLAWPGLVDRSGLVERMEKYLGETLV